MPSTSSSDIGLFYTPNTQHAVIFQGERPRKLLFMKQKPRKTTGSPCKQVGKSACLHYLTSDPSGADGRSRMRG